MTPEQNSIYNKAVRKLKKLGVFDPTSQIIALEIEIDYYRERIKRLLDSGYRETTLIIDETKICAFGKDAIPHTEKEADK